MIFTYRQPAGPDQRFAPGCFDSSIGQQIPVVDTTGRLTSYVVADDGTWVDLTFDTDRDIPQLRTDIGTYFEVATTTRVDPADILGRRLTGLGLVGKRVYGRGDHG